MARSRKNSSLLAKYSLMYEKKPRSRVFAPLAETYRKLGMVEEAIQILQKGIKIHPTYTLAYIVLSNCFYDLQNFEMAYNTIRSFVPRNLENISMQKLFAKTCMKLGYLDEALNTYKNLLLLNPRDLFVADQVKLLEDDLLVNEEEEFVPQATNNSTSFEEDNWIQVDFNKATPEEPIHDEIDWEVKKADPIEDFKNQVKSENLEVQPKSLDDEFYLEDYDTSSDDVIAPEAEQGPIITHTLVDLYCSQGHFDKAVEILKDILKLHPDDKATQEKLNEINSILLNQEEQTKTAESKLEKIEKLYGKYLAQIRTKSQEMI